MLLIVQYLIIGTVDLDIMGVLVYGDTSIGDGQRKINMVKYLLSEVH